MYALEYYAHAGIMNPRPKVSKRKIFKLRLTGVKPALNNNNDHVYIGR